MLVYVADTVVASDDKILQCVTSSVASQSAEVKMVYKSMMTHRLLCWSC